MNSETRQFTYRNESFECANCGAKVLPASKSCRNHCPFCLHSMHLDIFPGDRSANCGGVMVPIRVEYHSKKGYQIIHQCTKCGQKTKNVLNLEDKNQPDSMEIVLNLMKHRQ